MSQEIAFHAGPAAQRAQKLVAFAKGFVAVVFLVLAVPFLWAGLRIGAPGPLLVAGLCLLLALGTGFVRGPRYAAGAPLLSVSPQGLRVFPASNAKRRDPVTLHWAQIASIAVHHPPRSRPILRITPTEDAARALGLRGPQWRPSVLTRWTRAQVPLSVDLFDCGQDALLRHLANAASQSVGPIRQVPRWDGGARLIFAPPGSLPEIAR